MQSFDQKLVLEIANAKSGIDSIQAATKSFLDKLRESKDSPNVPAKLSISETGLTVLFFGYRAEAKARFIRAPKGTIAAEYVFFVDQNDEKYEVWRFYLSQHGQLFEDVPDPSSGITFSEFGDLTMATKICSSVVIGALNSHVFSAAAKPPSKPFTGIY